MVASVRRVAGHWHIAAVEALIFLIRCPDKTVARRLFSGFSLAEHVEESFVFRTSREDPDEFLSRDELLADAPAWIEELLSAKAPLHAYELYLSLIHI